MGFRGETPVLFDVRPARAVPLSIHDADGSPTVASLTIRDRQDRVFPPQVKRLAPDFFFQPQIYRADGDVVLLPPGRYVVEALRAEYGTPAGGGVPAEGDGSSTSPRTLDQPARRVLLRGSPHSWARLFAL
jgi:hypothetical protein